jgi:hypothetical protein
MEAAELALTSLTSRLSSVWDFESGKDAEQQGQAAEVWRAARTSGCAWAPVLKDGAVELVVDGSSLATVYLMPPMQLEAGTLCATKDRLAAFNKGNNVFALFELNVQGEQLPPAH